MRRTLSTLLSLVSWLSDVLRLDQWIIEGVEEHSKQPLMILYAGNSRYPENKNLIIHLAFKQSFTETPVGRVWLWNAGRAGQRIKNAQGLIVVEVPHIFRFIWNARKTFFLPTWFDGKLDVTLPTATDSTKTDIKRIKKNRLRYVVTTDEQRFKDFYDNMHVPYISNTFGGLAFIHNYHHMRKSFGPDGPFHELLLVLNEDTAIAGILLGREKDELYLYYVGVKDGKIEYVQEGALGALFYFPVEYARTIGLQYVNFGLTRPFLKDGVLQFKKKRGMDVSHRYKIGYLLQVVAGGGGVNGFLLNNPFLYMADNRFYGALFVDGTVSLSAENLKRLYKDFYLQGMDKLFIYPLEHLSADSMPSLAEYSGAVAIGSTAGFWAG
jgi:hypothetical protein